tara:strand:+ start:450 stop:854 length:405 start_codon:yes stop_codon:yes gene_type:complete
MCNLYHHSPSVAEMASFFEGSLFKFSVKSRAANLESGYVGADQDGLVLVNSANKSELEFSIKRWGFPAVREKAKPITNIRNLNSSWWTGINGDYVRQAEYRCLVPFNRFTEWDAANKRNAWFEIDAPQSFFAGI